MNLKPVLDSLYQGKLDMMTTDFSINVSRRVKELLDKQLLSNDELAEIYDILLISNIIYNNTNHPCPLEDGVYDNLVVKYNFHTNNQAPVGAPPIKFDVKEDEEVYVPELKQIVTRINTEDMLYFDTLTKNGPPIPQDFENRSDLVLVSKMVSNTAHVYPELVGTLDKCKFVLNSQAAERGLLDDNTFGNFLIFERDFFKHEYIGGSYTSILAELKYDGISVEAEIDGDTIVSARTRGDTDNDEASDLTPVLKGFKFHRATEHVPKGTVFGIKFEAIVTYYNMNRLKNLFGKSYTNPRNAVKGLLAGLDARKYLDFITLVPLACSKNLGIDNRQVEIEFLNKYYSTGVDLRYQVLSGDYVSLLFQVKKFVDEAEFMRPYLPFMYDGVVVSYTDPHLINYLGRSKSVNKYSTAIKFNALKKSTIFTGYSFSVGQNGLITPMVHFNPIEFIGGIHDKTTGHSLKRFRDLALRLKDVIDIEYVNDVICYVTKPYNSHNLNNQNPIIEFPTHCESCGGEIMMSDSGDSAYCVNMLCPERNIARMTNMLKKLNIKDFGTETVRVLYRIGVRNLAGLFAMDISMKEILKTNIGEVNTEKLFSRIQEIRELDFPDYRIIGSLGFSSIASEKWKLIMRHLNLDTLISGNDETIAAILGPIKGIGPTAIKTIISERPIFIQDLLAIKEQIPDMVPSYGDNTIKPSVRFTGIRDQQLEEAFNKIGYDADGNKPVTGKTNILVVPYAGYQSSKVNKVKPTCLIVTPEQAWKVINGEVNVTFF